MEVSERVNIDDLLGYTLTSVVRKNEYVLEFHRADGKVVYMLHFQECCECVYLDDVVGDLNDLVGSPLTIAEEYTHYAKTDDNLQYTFYRLATEKGFVTLRWNGTSSGYYSTSVSVGFDKPYDFDPRW